jgi:hypothetical protein
VESNDKVRLSAKLHAINFRVAELDYEMQRTQVHVSHLEAQLEDAKLAQLMGEDAGDPGEIGPELERSRDSLESQREVLDQVKKSQWTTRVHLTALQAKERMEQRQRAERAQQEEAE